MTMNAEELSKELKNLTARLGSRENLLRYIAKKLHTATTLFMREDTQMLDREDLLDSYAKFLTWLDNNVLKGLNTLKSLDDILQTGGKKIYYERSMLIQNEMLRGIFLPVPNTSEYRVRETSTQTTSPVQQAMPRQIPAKSPNDYFPFISAVSAFQATRKLNYDESLEELISDGSMCPLVSSSSGSNGSEMQSGDEETKSWTLQGPSDDAQSCKVIHSRISPISFHSIPEFMSIANFESTVAFGAKPKGSNKELHSLPEINNNIECATDSFTASISSSATRIKNAIAESVVGIRNDTGLGILPSRVASDERVEIKRFISRYGDGEKDAGINRTVQRSASDIHVASHNTLSFKYSSTGSERSPEDDPQGLLLKNAEVSLPTTEHITKTAMNSRSNQTVGCVGVDEVTLQTAVDFLRAELLSTPAVASLGSSKRSLLPPATSRVEATETRKAGAVIGNENSKGVPIRSDQQKKPTKVVRILLPEEGKATEAKNFDKTFGKKSFSKEAAKTEPLTCPNTTNVKWPSWKSKDIKIQVASHFVPPRNPIPTHPRNSNFIQPLRKRSQSVPAPTQYSKYEH